MNMRKIIAVLSAVLMLCAIIPMGALSVSAEDNLAPAYSSWTTSDGTATITDQGDGTLLASYISDYGWVGYYMTLEANTDYVMTFSMKASKADRKTSVSIKDSGWSTTIAKADWTASDLLGTDWVDRTFKFNSGEYTSTIVLIQSGHSSAWDGYIKDMKVVKDTGSGEDEAPANAVYYENFAEGTGNFKWSEENDTFVAEDGVAKWTTLSWKNLYSLFSVTANSDYKLTFKMKADAATSMEVKFMSGGWGDSGIEKETVSVGTEWQEFTRIFNSGSNSALYLLFQSHKATDVYIDDVLVVPYVVPVDPDFPENAIYTETFENGSLNGWTSNNSIAETAGLAAIKADGGNYAMNFVSTSYNYTNYQLDVEPNTDYKVVFSILGDGKNPIKARIRAGDADLGYTELTPAADAWATKSYIFNSGEYSSVGLRFQANWEAGTYYIDNIYVVPFDAGTLTDDGHVANGGFDTGDDLGWATGAKTEVVEDPTGAGQGYVLKTYETGSGVDMLVQEFKNLVAGETYTLTFKIYGYGTATNNAFYVRVPKTVTFSNQTGVTAADSGKTYVARYNLLGNTGAWYTVGLDFVADASTVKIQIQNYRADQGFYYIDDVVVSHLYNNEEVTEPTCGVKGYTTYSCICGASYEDNYVDALDHNYVDGVCENCNAEDPNYNPHVCEIVELERVEAGCETEGYVKYGCECGEGVYTEPIYPQGHTYDVIDHKDATCGAAGYNTFSCVDCGDSYDVAIEATGEHVYFDDCSAICEACGEETREASHNVVHVEAVEATCGAMGNIEYWYCDVCGMAWTDEACTMNTNLRAVKLPATGEHTYDNEYDADCNGCGAIREVAMPIACSGTSVSEDVEGLAFRFTVDAQIAIAFERITEIDYANSVFGEYKLNGMGALMSNGFQEIDIPAVYAWNYTETSVSYAVRILELDEDFKKECTITAKPYIVIEKDGVEITVYGEVQSATYNGVLNG